MAEIFEEEFRIPKPPCIDCPVMQTYSEGLINFELHGEWDDHEGYANLRPQDRLKYSQLTSEMDDYYPPLYFTTAIDSRECKGPAKILGLIGKPACRGEVKLKLARPERLSEFIDLNYDEEE